MSPQFTRNVRAWRNGVVALGLMAPVALTAPGAAAAFDMNTQERASAKSPARSSHGRITTREWRQYERAFIRDGRVVDVENGRTSHSEGQGYGMILALHAGDRATFGELWRFTRDELQIRADDDLLSWQWKPRQRPHVPDRNNATDGDILVAYALLRAAAAWDAPRYARAAERIVDDIGDKLITRQDGEPVLRPAAFGFDRIPGNGGPVVNLSYYFYAAFPLFEVIAPEYPWMALARNGLELTGRAGAGALDLVPDWVAVSGGRPRIANGFDRRSSYDAVRIPLYILLGRLSADHVRSFDMAWNRRGDGHPVAYDFEWDEPRHAMADPGYRMIAALAACHSRRIPIPRRLLRFRPTTYFASSLHLLALASARGEGGECARPRPQRRPDYVKVASKPRTDYISGGEERRSDAHTERLRTDVAMRRQPSSGTRATPRPAAGESLSFSERIMRRITGDARNR